MKIAFILSSNGNYGPFIVARDIISGIRSKVETIDVFYLKESNDSLSFHSDKMRKIKFLDKLDFSSYDIVHSHGFLGDAYVYFHRKTIKSKKVTTIHQNIKPDYSMAYNSIVGAALEKVWCHFISKMDSIVCLSNDMVKYYSPILKSEKLTFVYNGINTSNTHLVQDVNLYQDLLDAKKDHIILGVSARLIYRKGIDLIINALSINENKKLILVIIGDGDQKNILLKLAEQLGVLDRVTFVGYQKHVVPYYKLLDFYIMSSRSEAFGLCVIEAASLKIPVICSDISVYREIFSDDEVERFTVDNPISLSNAINGAISHKKELSNKIYDKYLNNFTVEKMASKYLLIYYELLPNQKV